MLGSAFVFFMKSDIPDRMQKTLLGFASGVMVAASVWSLLIPSIDMSAGSVVPAAVGFMAGIAFLLLLDELTPHLHLGAQKSEGPRSRLSRTAMLANTTPTAMPSGRLCMVTARASIAVRDSRERGPSDF